MAEDPRHPWGSGATTHSWVAPVRGVIRAARAEFPHLEPNSYVCHPWCGWSRYSVDWWGPGGRGDPIDGQAAERLRHFLMTLKGAPYIRHTILDHEIWTSWGGYSYWGREDHTGRLRHLHVTYWR